MSTTPRMITAAGAKPIPKDVGATFGESGTNILYGVITGEEYQARLQGKYALRMFDIMRRSDSTVHAALQLVKLPILAVNRYIEPASDDELDQYIARFVEDQLFGGTINFTNMAREALTFLDFGHSVAEKTYGTGEFEGQTRIVLREIGFRKQTSIQAWETQDHKPGITQQLIGQGKKSSLASIIREKLIVWTNEQEGQNYEGVSILRFAFKDWDMKDKLGLVYAIGLEKMAIPTPILEVPTNADEIEKSRARTALRQYRANQEAYIEKPAGWKIEKFDLAGQSIAELRPGLQYFDRQIFMSALSGYQALGGTNGSSGSRAVGDVQYRPYEQQEIAINKLFEDVIQEQLIKQLVDLNFSKLTNGYPKLRSADLKDEDLNELATAISSMKTAGLITPDPELEDHLRKTYKLTPLPDDLRENYNQHQPTRTDPVVDPKDPTSKRTAAALRRARAAKQGLIDVITG